jgi:transcriptional regulator GlxA family with amidase domain
LAPDRRKLRIAIVRVEADRIFCRDGNVWTSAGITAGIDLALALIEEDHGFAVTKGVAQHLVVYHRRHLPPQTRSRSTWGAKATLSANVGRTPTPLCRLTAIAATAATSQELAMRWQRQRWSASPHDRLSLRFIQMQRAAFR